MTTTAWTFLAVLLAAAGAHAAIRWIGGFDNDDLRQWNGIHCGGQGGTCPCMAPYWDPTWQTNYGPGSCSTSNSNRPLSVAPANERFQIVSPPPGAENAGKAVRIELKNGDLWPCPSGCGSATTRNELVQSKDSGTSVPTSYKRGDERYFAWSTYFPAAWASWSCNDSMDGTGRDTNCPGGIPNSNYNPWNVITQFHHNTDSGVPPTAFALRRSGASHSYALALVYGYSNGNDTELWRQDLQVETWYDFVLHVKFSQRTSQGLLELWVGKNGGPKQRITLHCPGGDSVSCAVATLYPDGIDYLLQGLYRNSSLVDDSVIFHKGMIDGDTYADVTGDFSLSSSTSATVAPGQSATYTIQTAATAGTAQKITLSVSGLPPGVTGATFNPPTVVAGASSTLTLTTDPASAGLSATFTVSGWYPGGAPGHTITPGISIGLDVPPPPPPAPAPVSTLVDSFAGSSIDPSLWTVTDAVNATASDGGGSLNLAPNANSATTRIAVDSNATYALTGSAAAVKVPKVVSAGCGVNNVFTLRLDAANSLSTWFECGTLYAITFVNGAESIRASVPYSATSHAYWRIRESAGSVYWETSADKVSWAKLASVSDSSLFSLESLIVEFYAETYAALANPGVASYSGLNQ